jgi:microsomal epoxide hydrolase
VGGGIRIHVLEAGPARSARPTLVLVPGWRFGARVWAAQVRAFSRERRVIAVDPRSQGLSTVTADGDTPEQRARDLRAALAALRVGPRVLVGWSQGVQDAAAYAQQFAGPEVAGMVLVDAVVAAGAGDIRSAPEAAARQIEMLGVLARAPEAFSRGMLAAVVTRPLTAAETDAYVAEALRTPPAIAQAMLLADLYGPDRRPALARMAWPTLVVASARAPDLDAQRAMAAALPDGRFESVADAGHAVFVDQPDRFNALLGAFLAQVDRAQPRATAVPAARPAVPPAATRR